MNRFSIAALFVLALGLGAGTTIYFTAEEPAPTAYIMIGDTAYPYDPATSKTYVRQIERFGGKGAVLLDELSRWFVSLWVGKALGITIACLTAGVAGVLYWIGRLTVRTGEPS
jgi:hypothetical protein